MPSMEICRVALMAFELPRKSGFENHNPAHMHTNATNMPSSRRMRRPFRLAGHEGGHVLLGEPIACDGPADAPVAKHDDPIAEADDLLELRADHQDRDAALGERDDFLIDLGLRGDVDAAGRLIENEH